MSKLSIFAGVAAAALLAMSPAAALAQENTANTTYAAEPAANTAAADPLATEPVATTTADPLAADPAVNTADYGRRNKTFPWGLLGLLGLVGLLGTKRAR